MLDPIESIRSELEDISSSVYSCIDNVESLQESDISREWLRANVDFDRVVEEAIGEMMDDRQFRDSLVIYLRKYLIRHVSMVIEEAS